MMEVVISMVSRTTSPRVNSDSFEVFDCFRTRVVGIHSVWNLMRAIVFVGTAFDGTI